MKLEQEPGDDQNNADEEVYEEPERVISDLNLALHPSAGTQERISLGNRGR